MECDVCGSKFRAVKSWQKRCSAKCNSIAGNTRRRKDPDMKTCRTCQLVLAIDRFEPASRHCIGCAQLQAAGMKRCTACREVLSVENFHRRPARAGGYESRCRVCKSEASKRRNADPGKKARDRDNKYRLKYGISADEVDAMLREQDGKCAICGEWKTSRLHVDHDHKTGAVRALLCAKCNTLLGLCGDNAVVLQNAITYLERHNSHAHIRA